MTMTQKLNKLISFIRESLGEDDEVKLYQSDLLESGLLEKDIIKTIDELTKQKAVTQQRIMFAPNKIQSTYPKRANFSSAQNATYNTPVFFLKIDRKKFQEVAEQNLSSKFLDKEAKLLIGKQTILLPPQKNEHCFCRVMFHYPVNEPIDWSEVYEEITGGDIFGEKDKTKTKWRMVYDTVEAINGRVKKYFDSPLFKWEEKTIRRLY